MNLQKTNFLLGGVVASVIVNKALSKTDPIAPARQFCDDITIPEYEPTPYNYYGKYPSTEPDDLPIGVSFISSRNNYIAYFKRKKIGCFLTWEAATLARDKFISETNSKGKLFFNPRELRERLAGCKGQVQTTSCIKKATRSSKYDNVSYSSKMKRWKAEITHNSKHYYLGSYDTELEAAEAVQAFRERKKSEDSEATKSVEFPTEDLTKNPKYDYLFAARPCTTVIYESTRNPPRNPPEAMIVLKKPQEH